MKTATIRAEVECADEEVQRDRGERPPVSIGPVNPRVRPPWQQWVNQRWVTVNLFWYEVFGGQRRTWLCDPAFLFWYYYNRNLTHALPWVHGTLLDVGSGNEGYRPVFMPRVARYVSLDYPSGREVHLVHQERVHPMLFGDALHLPIRSETVDTVVSLQVLEHLPDPPAAVQEVSRVLRTGGCFILTTHGLFPIHGAPQDYLRFTEFSLRELLASHGLQIVRLDQNGSFWALMGLFFNNYLVSHCFEQRRSYMVKVCLGTLKILLMPLLLVVFGAVNALGWLLDWTHHDPTFTSNYTVVAQKA